MSSSYPIRAVAKLTGIPEDTLRAWERRYSAVTPRRAGRGRAYSDKEIQRLLLLREAVARGHSIGQIAAASDDRLRALLNKSTIIGQPKDGKSPRKISSQENAESVLSSLLGAVEVYDYLRAERELARLSASISSPRELVHNLASPLMRITGERWHEGRFTIAQEHMITALLTGLFASMLRLYAPANPPAKVLMATPENEHHGFGILAGAMLAAAGGLGAIHLGTNLPTRDIIQAARKTEANAILLGMSGANTETVVTVMQEIQSKALSRTQLWIGGASDALAETGAELGWTVLKDFHALERQMALLGARF
jgi:DNA-binding transcriptional MerR regulator/methylmalonyl-CoA mutase cobalamin-binding subunit